LSDSLRSLGINAVGSISQIKNAYTSCVFRCPTDAGELYLKIPTKVFIREFEITRVLKDWDIVQLPEWAAFDEGLKTFLMRDMGGADLSTDASLVTMMAVVQSYAIFQKKAINLINLKEVYPFYDLTSTSLKSRMDSLVTDAVKLLRNSEFELNDQEIAGLLKRIPYWKALVGRIEVNPIPNSVDHGDLHAGNIRITEDGIIFFDWGWSAISHPFFSISSFLHSIRKSITASDKLYLRDTYLQEWQSYASMEQLVEIYQQIEELNYLYHVVGDHNWLEEVQKSLAWRTPNITSPDAYTLYRRQYYYARVLRRLI